MPAQPRSNIRAYVHWKSPDVFAGEEIECIITFKNIASTATPEPHTNGRTQHGPARYAPSIAQTVASSTIPSSRPTHTRTPSISSVHAPPARGHRPTLSLNLVRSNSVKGGSTPLSARTPTIAPVRGHGRSLSILSLGKETVPRSPTTLAATRKPLAAHSRSSSLQVTSRTGLQSAHSTGSLPTRRHSPLFEATSAPDIPAVEQLPVRPVRRKTGTNSTGTTPVLPQGTFASPEREAIPSFEFPPRNVSLNSPTSPQKMTKPARTISNMHSSQSRPLSPRPVETFTAHINSNPLNRVLSESSASGTPRSSGDFYSLSNHSDETLSSNAPAQTPMSETTPTTPKPRPPRKQPQILGPARPETLMIGYARPTGTFRLDSSLVNNAPFEDIKRKTVQGGGGVVGVEKPKRSSGLFGWGGFGESISGLLGGNDMSTIAQMKADAGTKEIPLLSTPQSLLFVDVTLAPGESKSYIYRFPLPRGLPPSHKGRAMKVEYSLTIGVQRPDGQAVKYVDVPFRVLGSVSPRGMPLGHDLMTPYVLLQDTGRVNAVSIEPSQHNIHATIKTEQEATGVEPKKAMESFLRYTERLLGTSEQSNEALLSPTSILSPTAGKFEAEAANAKEAIDLALMTANLVSGEEQDGEAQSGNRFNINRSGQPVAVLTLLRPAYRLGESVIGTIDFSSSTSDESQIQSYSVFAELQSAEQVDTLLAVRSAASIQRVTKRIHASTRENTLFARKIGFSLPIPTSATPSFDTSGVSLSWTVKIEFTTFRQLRGPGGDDQVQEELLEELTRDERGISLIAKDKLVAESFDIVVPLRVYGAFSVGNSEKAPEMLEV